MEGAPSIIFMFASFECFMENESLYVDAELLLEAGSSLTPFLNYLKSSSLSLSSFGPSHMKENASSRTVAIKYP